MAASVIDFVLQRAMCYYLPFDTNESTYSQAELAFQWSTVRVALINTALAQVWHSGNGET